MPHPETPARRPSGVALLTMVGIGSGIMVVGALGLGRAVFAPLLFAIFIVAVVWPLQARLQRFVPRLLALAITLAAAILSFGAFAYLLSWAFSHVARYAVSAAGQFQALFLQLTTWAEGHGIEVSALWVEHFNVGWILSAAQVATTMLNDMLSFSLVVLVYVIIGLLEVEPASRRVSRMSNRTAAGILRDGCALIGSKYRRYLGVRTAMSIVTGLLVWAFVSVCGVPLAVEWGIIAFAFNYIPVIGPLVATVLPTLFAIAQFDTWQSAAAVFAVLNLIQFLVGSYLEPRVAGNVLSLSPFLVLFAVFFWTWLWGLAGAFIGVPVVIAILTFCGLHPSSRWVTEVFGTTPAEQPGA